MGPSITTFADEAKIALDNLGDLTGNLVSPSIRFGVTGLSRAGKTIFITALVHNFIHGGRLPLFEPWHSGRISSAGLRPQPSMDVPRFQYEEHVRTLVEKRNWPDSTRAISELRLTVNYESATAWGRAFGSGTLNIDIVDYPGEWLLDLPLLGMDYNTWSSKALRLARDGKHAHLAGEWLGKLKEISPGADFGETKAIELATLFTNYLREAREDETALSTLPPGRFLMPGDLEGSPALTFCPLEPVDNANPGPDSLYTMMSERFEAYKQFVIKPFFLNHFARIDRQIVLVDVLQAINAGPDALIDLEGALSDILACFRPGRPGWLSPLFGRRIDRILFAATKADHLHHENHNRLEAVLRKLVSNAMERAKFSGAEVEVLALAAVRATHEAVLRQDGDDLPVIMGTPLTGERIGADSFDGETETAIFPGDLPRDPSILFNRHTDPADRPQLRFVKFRPPRLETSADGATLSLPHIRLDRALDFLFADKLA